MKKFLYITLLIFIMTGCADDNSTNGGSTITPPTNEVIVISNEVEIGKTADLSFTLKNPHNVKANLYILFNITDQAKLQIKDTTCGTLTSNSIDGPLEAGQECTINYTFAPNDLSTEVIFLNIAYEKNSTALCNNLTLDNIKTNNINSKVKVINYAKDINGNKSPNVEEIAFKLDYALLVKNKTYTTTKKVSFDAGTYNINAPDLDLTVKALDSNCKVSGSTLDVLNSNACNLEFSYNTSMLPYNTYAIFNSGTKNYVANITFEAKWEYILFPTPSPFNIQYINGIPSNRIYTLNTNSSMDYKLEGADASKFQVIPAPFDGCTVTATDISLPQGKSECYYTIDLTDDAKQTDGNYTAQISSTTTGVTLNINGSSIANTLEYYKNNMCSAKP